MDDIYVILAIFGLVFITFIVLFAPSPFKMNTNEETHNKETKEKTKDNQKSTNENKNKNDNDKKLKCFDPRMQSLNTNGNKNKDIGTKHDEETLASFYEPAKNDVPVNFPIRPVEQCAASKPQSNDLPLMDIPMCIVDKHNYNMRLNY